jgi:hypothetical protein
VLFRSGRRSRRPRLTFDQPFASLPPALHRRVRLLAMVAVAGLAVAFYLLGYTPLFAADKISAKYGVGFYAAGFARGAQIFRVALTLASGVAAALLAVVFIRRRRFDALLLVALGMGMVLTLSRGLALAGPLAFLVAWGVERRWRPWHLLALVCLAFVGGALVNELAQINAPVASASFASRVAGTVPDISDHVGFLHGFRLQGSEHVGLKTIGSAFSLSPSKGRWDASDYALRIRTGLPDVSELAAGGLRLPAAIWGYAAFGYAGVFAWSFLSGVVVGWGTALLRRVLAPVEAARARHQSLNLVLAWVFYNGTFGVLSAFYFPTRADIMLVGLAVLLGIVPLSRRRAGPPPPQPAPATVGADVPDR